MPPRTYPPPRPKKAHVIDDISFKRDTLVCSCAWRGRITEFPDHRRAFGLPPRSKR